MKVTRFTPVDCKYWLIQSKFFYNRHPGAVKFIHAWPCPSICCHIPEVEYWVSNKIDIHAWLCPLNIIYYSHQYLTYPSSKRLRDHPKRYMWGKKGNPCSFMSDPVPPKNERSLKSYPTHLHASPELVSGVSLSGDGGELFLCRDISWVRRTNEIYAYTKTINLYLQTRIHHELVLVFMPYYFCFD